MGAIEAVPHRGRAAETTFKLHGVDAVLAAPVDGACLADVFVLKGVSVRRS